MKTFILLLFSVTLSYAQQLTIAWQKCVGGTAGEYGWSVKELSDGTFITCGYTDSNNGDFINNKGEDDCALIKLSSTGTVLWSKLFGGTGNEEAIDVISTSDNGFIFTGYSESNDNDVSGNHGYRDIWVVKTDASGTLQWQKCYGGSQDDESNAIIQTSDGGYIIVGSSYSSDGEVTGHHGTYNWDMWVIKISSTGTLEWQKCYGGTETEEGYSIAESTNGDFIVAGYTSSTDGDVSGNHGGHDAWIIRINSLGTLLWQRCMGGSSTEEFNSISINDDGTIMALGYSNSSTGDLVGTGFHGDDDFWLNKLSSSGTTLWSKCYGGPLADQANRMAKTADGSFLLCGLASSNGGDISGMHSSMLGPDIWVTKVNSSGTLVWQKCLGGNDQDEGLYISSTSDNNCIVSGFTYSTDGDVIGNHGNKDMWFVKLNGVSSNVNEITLDKFYVYPNPSKNIIFFSQEVALVTITNITGKQISIRQTTENNSLDISYLEPGIYFIKADDHEMLKWVKE